MKFGATPIMAERNANTSADCGQSLLNTAMKNMERICWRVEKERQCVRPIFVMSVDSHIGDTSCTGPVVQLFPVNYTHSRTMVREKER